MTPKTLFTTISGWWLVVGLIVAAVLVPLTMSYADTPEQKLARERYLEYAEVLRRAVLQETCPYNPATVIRLKGDNPVDLNAFVKTGVRFEIYEGSLRGVEATLAAGQANDWDKAVLLLDLLRSLQFKGNLVLVPRTEQEVANVLAEVHKEMPNWYSLAEAGVATLPSAEPQTKVENGNPPLLKGFPAENRLRYQRQSLLSLSGLLGESTTAGEREAPRLAAILKRAGGSGTFDFQGFTASRRTALKNRVLVEYEENGHQQILDPGPDREKVDQERLAKGIRLDTIPADQLGEVRLKVNLTQTGEGAATQPILVFEDRFPLAEPMRHAPRLEIVPVETPQNGSPAGWTPENWFDYLGTFQQFQVVLRKGDKTLGSKAFNLEGKLLDVTSDGNVANAGDLGQGAGGLFGGAFGGEEEEPAPGKPAKTTLENLVLELEVSLPGQPLIRQRRLLFGALRPGMTPVCTVDLLFGGGPISPTCTAWRTLDSLTANAPLLMRAMETAATSGPETPESVERMPTMLFDWQMGRLTLAARLLKKNPALRATGGAFCVLLTNSLERVEAEQRVRMRVAIDVVFDHLRLVPMVELDSAAAFQGNLQWGIAATALESGVLRKYFPSPLANGTIPAWVTALSQGLKPWVTTGDGDQTGAAPLALWAMKQMAPPSTLVFPGVEKPGIWWSVEPATGYAIGRGGCGEGLSSIEYVQLIKMNLSFLKCHLAFMQSMMSGGGEKAAVDWAMCMTGTDNPGSYVGWGGSSMEIFLKMESGGTIAQIGDVLGGLYDLAEMAKGASK